MSPADPNPPAQVLVILADCFTAAVQAKQTDRIDILWTLQWEGLTGTVRQVCADVTEEQQKQYITELDASAGPWGEWMIVRLATCDPFLKWPAWQAEARVAPGPAVGQNQKGGYVMPLRLFALPLKVLPDLDPLPPEDYRAQDPTIYPHGPPQTRVIGKVHAILLFCFLRNLLGFAVEAYPLTLLSLSILSLIGLAVWGNRSEAAFQGFFAANVALSAGLICLAGWEVMREAWLVWREGWFFHWKKSLIRMVGDPFHPLLLVGDSDELAILFAAFAGLAERVRYENPSRRLVSRMAQLLLSFADRRGEYVATGRICGPFGLSIGDVDGVEQKRAAADAARIPIFLIPASRTNIWTKIRQVWERDGGRRARLRVHQFVPAATMKFSGVFRASSLIAAVLIAAMVVPMFSDLRMLWRAYPPRLDGSARWCPRTAQNPDSNKLQLTFRGVHGNPADYFVVVTGTAHDVAAPPKSGDKTEFEINGQAQLKAQSDKYQALVPLSTASAGLDPHRLSVYVYQKRSIARLQLPPILVTTFGLPDVQVVTEGTPLTPSAPRNAVLPMMALMVAAVVRLPNLLAPRITCSPDTKEGDTFYCSVDLEYPPDLPEYSWAKESGDCDAEAWNGQTIQLTTPLPALDGECRLRAIVRDKATGQVTGAAEYSVSIQRNNLKQAMGPKPPVAVSPQADITRPAHTTEKEPQLVSFSPPDETLRQYADSAVVEGRAKGENLGEYIVAFYTRTPAGWLLQEQAAAIDPNSGKWEVKAHFGDNYAAVLARKTYNPEPTLQSLPRRGGGVVDVRTGS